MPTKVDNDESKSDIEARKIWIDAGLIIDDPTQYPGLLERIDHESGLDKDFQSIGYDTKNSIGFVRCSVCDHRQNHHKGFIIKNGSGEIGLVGIDCGENYFFGSGGWEIMIAATKKVKERTLIEKRWKPAAESLKSCLRILDAWRTALAPLDEFKSEFMENFSDLNFALANVANTTGQLKKEVIVDQPRRDSSGREYTVQETVLHDIGTLDAGWFFGKPPITKRLAILVGGCKKCLESLDDSNPDLSNADGLSKELRQLRNALQDISNQEQQIAALLSERIWKKITGWANVNAVGPANYRFKRGRLICSDKDYIYGELAIPTNSKFSNQYWSELNHNWPHL